MQPMKICRSNDWEWDLCCKTIASHKQCPGMGTSPLSPQLSPSPMGSWEGGVFDDTKYPGVNHYHHSASCWWGGEPTVAGDLQLPTPYCHAPTPPSFFCSEEPFHVVWLSPPWIEDWLALSDCSQNQSTGPPDNRRSRWYQSSSR